jgi:hypothetical protein
MNPVKPSDLIAKAREQAIMMRVEGNTVIAETITALADLAERCRGVLVENRAQILYLRSGGFNHCHDLSKHYSKMAAQELDIESSSWRKIGPDDRRVLDAIAQNLESYKRDVRLRNTSDVTVKQAAKVLRRLIGEDA